MRRTRPTSTSPRGTRAGATARTPRPSRTAAHQAIVFNLVGARRRPCHDPSRAFDVPRRRLFFLTSAPLRRRGSETHSKPQRSPERCRRPVCLGGGEQWAICNSPIAARVGLLCCGICVAVGGGWGRNATPAFSGQADDDAPHRHQNASGAPAVLRSRDASAAGKYIHTDWGARWRFGGSTCGRGREDLPSGRRATRWLACYRAVGASTQRAATEYHRGA